MTFALLLIMGLLLSGCSSSSGGSGGDPSIPSIPSNVSEPTLRITLPASWDENWFASASVFDLDVDGDKEIIAARHSVLYVWNDEDALVWRGLRWESPQVQPTTMVATVNMHRLWWVILTAMDMEKSPLPTATR